MPPSLPDYITGGGGFGVPAGITRTVGYIYLPEGFELTGSTDHRRPRLRRRRARRAARAELHRRPRPRAVRDRDRHRDRTRRARRRASMVESTPTLVAAARGCRGLRRRLDSGRACRPESDRHAASAPARSVRERSHEAPDPHVGRHRDDRRGIRSGASGRRAGVEHLPAVGLVHGVADHDRPGRHRLVRVRRRDLLGRRAVTITVTGENGAAAEIGMVQFAITHRRAGTTTSECRRLARRRLDHAARRRERHLQHRRRLADLGRRHRRRDGRRTGRADCRRPASTPRR